ncbi:flavin reductase family protein [Flindersiella endophytica]
MNVPLTPSRGSAEQAAYRAALRRFASGVTIVTTIDAPENAGNAGNAEKAENTVDHAMTATAFTSLSLDPPLVLVCVEKIARFHQAVLDAGVWGVSILAETGQEAADSLAIRGRELDGQLTAYAIKRGVTGVALFTDALARLECRTTATHDGGDHTIVVGEVVSAEAINDEARVGPLVYYAGRYISATNAPGRAS